MICYLGIWPNLHLVLLMLPLGNLKIKGASIFPDIRADYWHIMLNKQAFGAWKFPPVPERCCDLAT